MQAGWIDDHAELLQIVGVAELVQGEGLVDRGRLTHHVDRAVDRLLRESNGDRASAVIAAFKHVLQRLPSEREARLAENFLSERTFAELCRSLLNTNELMFVP